MEAVARVGSLQLKILSMVYTKRILFKVSNQLYLKLNNGENELTPAGVVKEVATRWRSSSPKINKRASEQKN